jgi:hypothetical protein
MFWVFQTRESLRWPTRGCTLGGVSLRAGRLLLPPGLGKSHRMLWHMPEQVWKLRRKKKKSDVQRYPCAFLVSTYLHSRKKRNLTFRLPLLCMYRYIYVCVCVRVCTRASDGVAEYPVQTSRSKSSRSSSCRHSNVW